jgi:hypothetical protein
VGQKIEWAQPYGALKSFNGIRVFAQICAQIAADAPRERQIRVQKDRAVYVGDPVFELTSQIAQASSARQQRDRIVHADRHRAARQPHALLDFAIWISQPAVRQARDDAPYIEPIGGSIGGIEVRRAAEEPPSFQ